MESKVTDVRSTVEQRLCNGPDFQVHKKPVQSVRECIDLCSSFLAERGCLTLRPRTPADESAAA